MVKVHKRNNREVYFLIPRIRWIRQGAFRHWVLISTGCPGRETMFSAGPSGAWLQDARHARAAASGRTASDAVRPCSYTTKEELALRKKNERAHTTKLMATLEFLAPIVDENKGQPGHRSKALRGRTRGELLKDVMHAVRHAVAQGLRSEAPVLAESE